MENYPDVTKERVKQMKGWENMPDDVADKIARAIRTLAEILYRTVSRELSLTPLPEPTSNGKIIPLINYEETKLKAA